MATLKDIAQLASVSIATVSVCSPIKIDTTW
ncbi:LacI family DNA-binding transcriptional regulator [Mycobacterium tuberculosis]|nr:LacI family DNA-binding transcriptional regulator [Mycobacterium tuberculosis]